jgi:diguanylate cyclase (GGDEF)-like protein
VPNDLSFCAATIEKDDGVLVVPDTRLDPAFASNPLVTDGPRVGHYAGASIICDGEPVGVVCVFGPGPREFSDVERDGLGVLARQAASQLTLRLENRALGQMAVTDPLTGLANRTLLLDRLDHALDSRRRGGGEVGVLFCDVDGFKAVNDSFGHEEGDRLLCAIASGLRASARSSDVVSRIAGDEFVVVCPAVGGPEELAVIAARLSSSGSALPEMPDGSPAPRLSVGAVLATDADSATTVVRRADQAMYASKDARRRLAVAVAVA